MVTLRNKIGQMLVMGFNGCTIHDKSPVAQWLANDGLGGVILFNKDVATRTYGKNLKSISQIKQLISQLNHYASTTTHNLPLLTAIDYEGGHVDRLTTIESCMPTLSAFEMAKLTESDLEEELTQMANTLKSLGFNLNFAPVVDLHLAARQGIIGKLKRCFSENPHEVIRVSRQFVDVFSRNGIACAYKHFPGHGSANGDTHEGFVDVTETFQHEELIPYHHLLQDNEKPIMVMTAHVINKHLDSTGLPATLSFEILTGILRRRLSFDGVIISDDMQMLAIAQYGSLKETISLTINAGADMLIFANQLGSHDAPQLIDIIEELVLCGKVDPQRIEDSFRRVMRLKQHMELSCSLTNA